MWRRRRRTKTQKEKKLLDYAKRIKYVNLKALAICNKVHISLQFYGLKSSIMDFKIFHLGAIYRQEEHTSYFFVCLFFFMEFQNIHLRWLHSILFIPVFLDYYDYVYCYCYGYFYIPYVPTKFKGIGTVYLIFIVTWCNYWSRSVHFTPGAKRHGTAHHNTAHIFFELWFTTKFVCCAVLCFFVPGFGQIQKKIFQIFWYIGIPIRFFSVFFFNDVTTQRAP